MRPEIAEAKLARVLFLVLEELPSRLGGEYLAAVGRRRDARGSVHCDSEVAPILQLGPARVHAHPHARVRAAGPVVVLERALCVGGGEEGVRGRPEGEERRVALRVDLLSPVRCDGLAQDPLVLGEHVPVLLAEGLQQRGRALHVGEQEGRGTGAGLGHRAAILPQ